MRTDRVIVYRGKDSDWRWRYVASNGRIMADGAEGYRRRVDCEKGARRVTGHRVLVVL